MLIETESEETIGFFVIFLSLAAFQLGEAWGPSPPPLVTPMGNTLDKYIASNALNSFAKKYFKIF